MSGQVANAASVQRLRTLCERQSRQMSSADVKYEHTGIKASQCLKLVCLGLE